MTTGQQVRSGAFSVAQYAPVGGRSNFRSGQPGAAIWVVIRDGGVPVLYQSQGRSVIEAIQCAVNRYPDGYWGPRTNAGLREKLQERGVDTDFIRDGEITYEMLTSALWITFNDDQVVLPPGTILPLWNQLPGNDGDYANLTWVAELPTSVTLPAASTHRNYRSGPPCRRSAPRRVGVNETLNVGLPQTNPGGALDDLHIQQAVDSFWNGHPLLPGDAPNYKRVALVATGLTLAVAALVVIFTADSPPPRPQKP